MAFCLYIAGQSQHSILAYANFKKIFDAYFPGQYTLKTIDLIKYPGQAKKMQIIAVPTIIKIRPLPTERAIGDFSTPKRMLSKLNVPVPSEKELK